MVLLHFWKRTHAGIHSFLKTVLKFRARVIREQKSLRVGCAFDFGCGLFEGAATHATGKHGIFSLFYLLICLLFYFLFFFFKTVKIRRGFHFQDTVQHQI